MMQRKLSKHFFSTHINDVTALQIRGANGTLRG